MIQTQKENIEHRKFVPKRRAPYLLQKEVIESKKYVDKSSKNKKNIDNQIITIGEDTRNNELSNACNFVTRLYGIQKKIMLYFFDISTVRGDLSTGSVTASTLNEVANSTAKTVKKAIQRLIDRKLIEREGGKSGKGGFSCFRFPKNVRNALFEYNKQLEKKNHDEQSSFKEKNIGINREILDNALPDEWNKIDYRFLSNIGFSETHIRQLHCKGTSSAEIVQQSIDHFSFALENNQKEMEKYNKPLKVLMGVLLKGGSWVEDNYKSPKQILLEKSIQITSEQLEKEKILENKLFDIAFEKWSIALTNQEKLTILPAKLFGPEKAHLKRYFKGNIWQSIKENLSGVKE